MAHDQELADRVRTLVAGAGTVEEKRMFGGLSFLVGGHLAVAASSRADSWCPSAPNAATRSSPGPMWSHGEGGREGADQHGPAAVLIGIQDG